MASVEYRCPLCSGPLVPRGKAYSLDELLAGWHPARFSRETLEDLRGQSDRTRLHECGACAFGIFQPQIIGNSSFYAEIEAAYSGDWYQDWKWEFGEAVSDAKSCRNILDVGCGTGGFLAAAMEGGAAAAGVDFNESALAVARGRSIPAYPSLESVPMPENRFDGIFAFHVLEHVPDPVSFLARLADFLAPSGMIGLSVPNMEGPVRFIDPCYMNMPPHHATRWTSRALVRLAEQAGFSAEKVVSEPLSSRDRDYYTTHWVNRASSGNDLVRRVLRYGTKLYFRALFGLLSLAGRSSTPLHSGQSVYILMRRKRERPGSGPRTGGGAS